MILSRRASNGKDRAHLLSRVSAEGKVDQMLDRKAEMKFRDHIWSLDSTHECFHSREYERLTQTELKKFWIFDLVHFFFEKNVSFRR